MRTEHDEAAKKMSISVSDAAEKHQRAMWGEWAARLKQADEYIYIYIFFAPNTDPDPEGYMGGLKNIANMRCPPNLGTMRALIQNTVSGVSEGHLCILRLVGVGYRATIEETAQTKTASYPGQKFVNLKLGYAHPVEMGVPEGVKASTPQPTRILLEGCDKQAIKQFAAEIRRWRKPEPYKGKGIFVNDETIRLKAKKIK